MMAARRHTKSAVFTDLFIRTRFSNITPFLSTNRSGVPSGFRVSHRFIFVCVVNFVLAGRRISLHLVFCSVREVCFNDGNERG